MRRWGALGALALLSACVPRLDVGTPCTRASECDAPLACQLGRCRSECVADRDCPLGARCVPAEDGIGVCTLPSEDDCTAAVCPSPLACRSGRCEALCADESDCLASQQCYGLVCVAREVGPDTGSADAGSSFPSPRLCASEASCQPGEICASDESAGVCRAACTAHSDCPESSVCDDYYADVDGGRILGCSTVCRPGTNDGCPEGASCRMAARSMAVLVSGPPALTLCTQTTGTGLDGCRCDYLETSIDCAAGYSCEQPTAGRMCLRVCAVGTDCGDGRICQRTGRSVVVQGVEYGVCPPLVSAPLSCP